MSAEAAHDELIALVSKTSEGPLLSETARAWCADVGVLRRYIDCAEANGCAAADNAQFLAKTARWRDAWRVDAMMDDEPLLEYERELRKLLLYDLATDHVGRPLLIERIGAWDLAALTEAVEAESERIVRAHVLVSERIRRQVDGRVREAPTAAQRQAVCVFDMEGIGWAHLRATSLLSAFSTMSRLDTENFPDTLGHIFVVNGSRIFTALWAIASTFLAESTCAKVSVFSWSEAEPMRAALREACGADALPQELGGTRADAPPYH